MLIICPVPKKTTTMELNDFHPQFIPLYTDNFESSSSNLLSTLMNDSALADAPNSDSHYIQLVSEVIRWCKDNYLDVNMDKTRQMAVAFRRKRCVNLLLSM